MFVYDTTVMEDTRKYYTSVRFFIGPLMYSWDGYLKLRSGRASAGDAVYEYDEVWGQIV